MQDSATLVLTLRGNGSPKLNTAGLEPHETAAILRRIADDIEVRSEAAPALAGER